MSGFQLPRLVQRLHPDREIARLHPTSLSITEKDQPLSVGTMNVPVDDYPVEPGQFVEVFDSNGSLGYYRIVNVTQVWQSGQRVQQCSLEHGISTLSQYIVFG